MTIKNNLKQAIIKLNKKKNSSACLDAELLLSHVLKKPRSYLYIWPEKKITKKQETRYRRLVAGRLKEEPVAYLVRDKEFYGLNFYVDKNVLIPRPETECLVEEIFKTIRHKPYAIGHKLTIADIGTGSGCLAITLKKYLPKAKIYASDISKKALAVAKKNAKKHKVKIFWKHGDLLTPLKKIKFNIIMTNLPYLTSRQMKNKTIQAEPKSALFGGQDGLDIYRELLNQIKELKYRPLVFLEIDPAQTVKIRKMIKNILPTFIMKIKNDLAGKERIVMIK
jgi:release factor glutamine methyltransferase